MNCEILKGVLMISASSRLSCNTRRSSWKRSIWCGRLLKHPCLGISGLRSPLSPTPFRQSSTFCMLFIFFAETCSNAGLILESPLSPVPLSSCQDCHFFLQMTLTCLPPATLLLLLLSGGAWSIFKWGGGGITIWLQRRHQEPVWNCWRTVKYFIQTTCYKRAPQISFVRILYLNNEASSCIYQSIYIY